MDASEFPLTFKTATLIEVLNERLQERVTEREAKAQAAADRNKTARDKIVEMIDKYPSFLVWLTNHIETSWRAKPGTEAFTTAITDAYATQDGVRAPSHDPDDDIKRLIRVYEKAEDQEVKVTVYDDVFRYL